MLDNVQYTNEHVCFVTSDGSISFMEHCNFTNVDVCGMSFCKKGLAEGWRRISNAAGGPYTDHTTLGKTGGTAA